MVSATESTKTIGTKDEPGRYDDDDDGNGETPLSDQVR